MVHCVYRSGCRDKHNYPRCDSNVEPLTPHSVMLALEHCDPRGTEWEEERKKCGRKGEVESRDVEMPK